MKKVLGLLLVAAMGFGGLRGAPLSTQALDDAVLAVVNNGDNKTKLLEKLRDADDNGVQHLKSPAKKSFPELDRSQQLEFYTKYQISKKIPGKVSISVEESDVEEMFNSLDEAERSRIDAVLNKTLGAAPEEPATGLLPGWMTGRRAALAGITAALTAGAVAVKKYLLADYSVRDWLRYVVGHRLSGGRFGNISPEKAAEVRDRYMTIANSEQLTRDLEDQGIEVTDADRMMAIREMVIKNYGEHNVAMILPPAAQGNDNDKN